MNLLLILPIVIPLAGAAARLAEPGQRLREILRPRGQFRIRGFPHQEHLLQRRQAATTLSHDVMPPRERGTTWSKVRSWLLVQ